MGKWEKYLLAIYPYLASILGASSVIAFVLLFYDFSQPPPAPIQIIDEQIAGRPSIASSGTDQVVSEPDNTTPVIIENSLININNATQTELEKLTNIGPATARKIIDYRLDQPFVKIEDIKNVSGIGEKTFEKIKDEITV